MSTAEILALVRPHVLYVPSDLGLRFYLSTLR